MSVDESSVLLRQLIRASPGLQRHLACGLYNFRKRLKCFRCGAAKVAIILRNIAPLSTVDGILNILPPYANLSVLNIRLIKDKTIFGSRRHRNLCVCEVKEFSESKPRSAPSLLSPSLYPAL
ncbi:RNA-binding protein 5-B [Liparis tanakae]|uniref:RNA-binding protein 5-B n=1 Tax=Liparis tanakae TaxID=230148 RepID=A0A4Z2J6K3_9TELE|nr:RNA-binding protein 5-B [Liparis tanakae]